MFNRYDAERYLLLAGDLPGYDVRLALRSAGAARGEVIGEVTVVAPARSARRHRPESGLARARPLGRPGARPDFRPDRPRRPDHASPLFSTADTSEQQTLQIAHDFRLGSEGLAIGGQFTYAWASPDLGLPGVDIDSRTLFATLEASYPFVRRQARTAARLGRPRHHRPGYRLQHHRAEPRPAPRRLRPAGFDALGLAPGNPRFTPAEPVWRLGVSAELRQGLDLFGAERRLRPGARRLPRPRRGPADPARGRSDRDRAARRRPRRISADAEAHLRAGRCAANGAAIPLFSFEEFSAGNYTAGRGYDPGTLLGDSGIGAAGRAPLRQRLSRPGRPISPSSPMSSSTSPGPGTRTGCSRRPRQELSSVGAGVRAAYGDRFRLDMLVAEPLDRAGLQAQARRHRACSSRLPPACGHGGPDDAEHGCCMLGCAPPACSPRRWAGLTPRPSTPTRRRSPAGHLRPRHAGRGDGHGRHRHRDHQLDPDSSASVAFLPAGNTATFVNGPNITDFAVLNRILTIDAGPVRRPRARPDRDFAAGTAAPGGTILFSSPGGIIIGPTAIFDVGNLVLTSLNVVDDGAGNFFDPANGIASSFNGGAGAPNAAVVTEPGAQINAPDRGQLCRHGRAADRHGGSVRVNGSAAYVAGERSSSASIRACSTSSSTPAATMPRRSSTPARPAARPASPPTTSTASTWSQCRRTRRSPPSSRAMSASITAVVAGVENGEIVLSAGHNVIGGQPDRFGDCQPAARSRASTPASTSAAARSPPI